METFLRFKTGKWRRQFVLNAAIDGQMEPQLLWCWKLPIFFFSQRWGFNNFVWIYWKRVVVALFRRFHRSRWGNYHCCGLWLLRYVTVQCLLSVVFLALWFVNVFLTLNFTASIIYRFFSLSVTCGIFALWFSLNKMYVIKFSVSFHTDQIELKNHAIACYNRSLRSTKNVKRATGHLSPPTDNIRGLKSLLVWWKNCIFVHLNAWQV